MNVLEVTNRQKNLALGIAINYNYGDIAMRILVVAWLIFQGYTYTLMSSRPIELFAPIHWFDKLFMPTFPNPILWYSLLGLAFINNLLLLKNGSLKYPRILLGLLVLWINCIRWKYEFFSHVGHVMVLYHLLGMFVTRKNKISSEDPELLDFSKTIQWLYAGVLIGYTFSGLWKLAGLVYKFFWHPEQINWLHPMAMKLNSIVGFRDWDLSLAPVEYTYRFLVVWQIAFIIMLILQVVSVLGAYRPQITLYIALGNICFHVINSLIIHIEFYLTPLVLLAVFFPYHLFLNKERYISFKAEKTRGKYTRHYIDGSKDVFLGFDAWREYNYDRNPLVYGLFYFPGLSTFFSKFDRK